ncbi:MAG TPA: hypothetical protein VFP92_02230 [Rhodanobacteraceae bacterium]|nr:hypothetical protein [Rhodanobacteraceae bacterium]
MMALVGKWAFIIGLIIAVLGGFGIGFAWFGWVMAVLGLIVGFLNVTEQETQRFLLAAIGLLVSAAAINMIPWIGGYAGRILANLSIFIGAAILVVALRSLFATMKN